MRNKTEVWLRGPLENIPALLQPVAHALMQAREELIELMAGFADVLLWDKPAGVASVGFHLQHLTGVLNRLFTYARGEMLSEKQLEYLSAEGRPNPRLHTITLVELFNFEVDSALNQLSQTPENILTDYRRVGRGQLPSTVIGLYTHAAEHTMRHLGQLLVTVRIFGQPV